MMAAFSEVGSWLFGKGSCGLLTLDNGMFVKCPESKLSEAEDVRWDDFLRGEGVSFLRRLLGDPSILETVLLGDLFGVILRFRVGDLVCFLGDLDLLRSEDLHMRGDRLLDSFFLLNRDSLLFLELGECLPFISFLLFDGEVFLLGDILLDLKLLDLVVAERLLSTDRLLDRLDLSLERLGRFILSCELLLE